MMMKETYDYWNANFAKIFRNVKENTENFNARVMNAILENERRKTIGVLISNPLNCQGVRDKFRNCFWIPMYWRLE